MKKSLYLVLLAAIASFAIGGQSANAATAIVVGKCLAGTQYTTIQAAVDAAPAGSTIDVCQGAYPEQVVITKSLTLQGVSQGIYDVPEIVPPNSGMVANDPSGSLAVQVLVEDAATVNLNNITIDATSNQLAACTTTPGIAGAYYSNSGGTINRVTFRNQRIQGETQHCQGSYGVFATVSRVYTATLNVQNSSFRNMGFFGIVATGFPGLTINVTNNYLAGVEGSAVSSYGIYLANAGAGSVKGNTVVDFVDSANIFPFLDLTTSGFGIFIGCIPGITVSGNTVADTQVGILLDCNVNGITSTVTGNKIIETKYYDAIHIVGNGNTVQNNMIAEAGQSGIYVQNQAINNVITGNTIQDTCMGVRALATTTNTIKLNSYSGVPSTTSTVSTCGPLF